MIDVKHRLNNVIKQQDLFSCNEQTFADGETAHNDRAEWSWFYWF